MDALILLVVRRRCLVCLPPACLPVNAARAAPYCSCVPQDADYQQWYDEGAHPLRRQQHRAGGLEAAWAAVLGGPAAGSLVQQQLPRSLLQASGQMPWDAAAAACLRLLRLLLRSLGSGGADPVAVAAGADASAAPALLCSAQQSSVLLRAFAAPLRRQGALAAANALLGITGGWVGCCCCTARVHSSSSIVSLGASGVLACAVLPWEDAQHTATSSNRRWKPPHLPLCRQHAHQHCGESGAGCTSGRRAAVAVGAPAGLSEGRAVRCRVVAVWRVPV
jgi:hypothetical protein